MGLAAFFFFYKTSYLNEEVGGTELFTSIRAPWVRLANAKLRDIRLHVLFSVTLHYVTLFIVTLHDVIFCFITLS